MKNYSNNIHNMRINLKAYYMYCRPRHYGAGRLAWTGSINNRFFGIFLNTNLCFFFFFLTLAILVKSSLSNYST
jgi:hypothetical protein